METSAITPLLASPAHTVIVNDDPAKEIRYGLIVLGGFAALFLGWATLTPLDAAATAPGEISVSGHSQVVSPHSPFKVLVWKLAGLAFGALFFNSSPLPSSSRRRSTSPLVSTARGASLKEASHRAIRSWLLRRISFNLP